MLRTVRELKTLEVQNYAGNKSMNRFLGLTEAGSGGLRSGGVVVFSNGVGVWPPPGGAALFMGVGEGGVGGVETAGGGGGTPQKKEGVLCGVKDGRDYIEIRVSPSSFPISYHGEFHYRSRATKQQLTGVALSQFIMHKTGFRWEDVTVDGISADDLDIDSLRIFCKGKPCAETG